MTFTTYLSNLILDNVFGQDVGTPPSVIHVALATDVSSAEAGTFTELAQANGYARASIDAAHASSGWANAAGGQIVNSGEVEFPVCITSDWAQASYFVLCTGSISDTGHSNGGYAYGSLTTPKTVQVGDTAKFNAGDLVVSLD